ncbi:predicted protein [Scheffersomyces stipitis CBS 6054]|uniref:Cyclin-D1-binding protein 1-like N-terminal domain-containing protein n=1 Tax=Scheffersomyces stipitis (strain ATCC 58785 / CBS 6054 / NBRC 10063 / NRRL Y-11545) TaxID=322104 RepID=A3LS14_PICST|nr:predicted protein [Scheffersomyces stipitis CBS 6054]ABN65485.2 predicted protein [Scheffersomyces stipitis CBS 6054]
MSKTKADLKDLLASYKEAVLYWSSAFENAEEFSGIQAAKVNKPLDELLKLAKLIKAHTTKVGIIFKPENLKKDANPAFTTLSKLSETLILLVSVVVQLRPSEISQLYYDELLKGIKQLMDSNKELSHELTLIFDSQNDENTENTPSKDSDEMDKRLVSVGKIWSNCDVLISMINNGALALLTDKIKQSVLLIEDGFEEFAEWTENVEEIDDDPFGFSDDEFSDEESEDDAHPPVAEDKDNKSEDDGENGEDVEELKKFAQLWLKKIELVKLLISSFKKSLPLSTSGSSIDSIYAIQFGLVKLIDKFIVDLMLDRTIDGEIEEYTGAITKESVKLAKLARDIHAKNNKKAKWYEAWETKFRTGL